MENMLMFMTLTKFVVCRMKWQPLAKFLAGKENDHIIHNYKTKGERLIFTKYKKIATKFIVITIPWVTLVLLLHYFKAVIPTILMSNNIIFNIFMTYIFLCYFRFSFETILVKIVIEKQLFSNKSLHFFQWNSNTSMGGIKRAVRYEEKARRKDKKILIECIMA
ncbi:odorant receptor 13a-like [Vespula squamosa]|uniref:Odorant receptor 13a-like n=1 Tax=Vespula squamosa TaxID=30214 RepID=A0ABD2BED9_VESSQ